MLVYSHSNSDTCIVTNEKHQEQGNKQAGVRRSQANTNGDYTRGAWPGTGSRILNCYLRVASRVIFL